MSQGNVPPPVDLSAIPAAGAAPRPARVVAAGAAAAAIAGAQPAAGKRTRFSRYQQVVHYRNTWLLPLDAEPGNRACLSKVYYVPISDCIITATVEIQRVPIPSAQNPLNPMASSPPVRFPLYFYLFIHLFSCLFFLHVAPLITLPLVFA
jgi:hypothetical protein